jgi:hypothetical protein
MTMRTGTTARAQVEEYNKKISQMQESSQITAGKTIKIRRHHDGGGSSYNRRDNSSSNYNNYSGGDSNDRYGIYGGYQDKSAYQLAEPEKEIDWDKIHEQYEIACKERWSKCPPFDQDFLQGTRRCSENDIRKGASIPSKEYKYLRCSNIRRKCMICRIGAWLPRLSRSDGYN